MLVPTASVPLVGVTLSSPHGQSFNQTPPVSDRSTAAGPLCLFFAPNPSFQRCAQGSPPSPASGWLTSTKRKGSPIFLLKNLWDAEMAQQVEAVLSGLVTRVPSWDKHGRRRKQPPSNSSLTSMACQGIKTLKKKMQPLS